MIENGPGTQPTSPRPARGVRIGIAVGTDTVVAALRWRRSVHQARVALSPSGGEPDPAAIARAFRELGEDLTRALGRPLGRARVHVALLPPLADARLVPLPPLRRREAEAVLRRDAARHFVGGAGARAVVVRASGRRPTEPVFASAAAVSQVDAVRAAAAAAGWRVDAVVPAHEAWMAAAQRTRSEPGLPEVRVVVAVAGDAVHVVRMEDGRPTGLRRLPGGWTAEIVDAAGPGPGFASVYAPSDVQTVVAGALDAAGWTVDRHATADAGEAAATAANGTDTELTTPAVAVERQGRARRLARLLVAAAAALTVTAAAAELWGARRELDAVLLRRASIRADVAPLLALRDSIGGLEARTSSIRSIAAASPRWTTALLDLGLLLPEDTHITTLHATGDTIFVEAAGARAGQVLQSLRGAGSLRDVRVDGVVERELEDGTTSVERFRLRARLAPPAAAAGAAPPGSTATAAAVAEGRTP